MTNKTHLSIKHCLKSRNKPDPAKKKHNHLANTRLYSTKTSISARFTRKQH